MELLRKTRRRNFWFVCEDSEALPPSCLVYFASASTVLGQNNRWKHDALGSSCKVADTHLVFLDGEWGCESWYSTWYGSAFDFVCVFSAVWSRVVNQKLDIYFSCCHLWLGAQEREVVVCYFLILFSHGCSPSSISWSCEPPMWPKVSNRPPWARWGIKIYPCGKQTSASFIVLCLRSVFKEPLIPHNKWLRCSFCTSSIVHASAWTEVKTTINHISHFSIIHKCI